MRPPLTLLATAWRLLAVLLLLLAGVGSAAAQEAAAAAPDVGAMSTVAEEQLAPGDAIRIRVFQNPELSVETRILLNGSISYPLIGSIKLAGQNIEQAEESLAKALKAGGFLQNPQITINLLQIKRKQVSLLGEVARPGPYALDRDGTRLSQVLAAAGGIRPDGSSVVIVTGTRLGQPVRYEVNLDLIYLEGRTESDLTLQGGDVIYVNKAPMFYIYGEAQKPGAFKLERNLTFMQALVTAGGITQRGTERNLRVTRREPDGSTKEYYPALHEPVRADDVIFVRESLF
ncbi:MAG: polysaccharide export protein EpsE [Comamonadaceae bacterium]|nr:polysaccharide export protein EpsE [Comamonadaceae bacterium]